MKDTHTQQDRRRLADWLPMLPPAGHGIPRPQECVAERLSRPAYPGGPHRPVMVVCRCPNCTLRAGTL